VPRTRDTVLGRDGKPRDAGNDGVNTIFLDIDRWNDKQNELDQSRIPEVRKAQVRLALHEPLVLAGLESNDNYDISIELVDILKNNYIDFNLLVGSSTTVSRPYKFFGGTHRSIASMCTDADVRSARISADVGAANDYYNPETCVVVDSGPIPGRIESY